jgi:hypothetical protein
VRLTLRTLLAYLDDTLEPLEIKTIGQKVAESDAAQELIARIKQVTRRRRITTPPATGPNSFDPNMVAEYLDNELSPEQIAELEKICLESDVHLAEVAACHQILTLVLGEPALVPPTAKERMYSLVQGREAIPFRKASAGGANASGPTGADADADEMFLLGLPFYRRGSWLRWALPLAGVLLLAFLGVALWQSINPVRDTTSSQQVVEVTKTESNQAKKTEEAQGNNQEGSQAKQPDGKEGKNAEATNAKNTDTSLVNKPGDGDAKKGDTEVKNPDDTEVKRPETDPVARKAKPSTDRVEVGNYYFDAKSPPSVLVQRKSDEDGWHRLKLGSRVATSDRLVSLPGYASEVRLDSGVHLLLRGHIKEFSMFPEMDYLQESTVILHKPKDVDADLTLETGRLFVSNHNPKDREVVVRLRFAEEVWDLTLHPGAEAVLDLLKLYHGGIDYARGEEPMATLHLFLLKGKAGIAIEFRRYPDLSAPPGYSYFTWDNKGAGVRGPSNQAKSVPPFFNKELPIEPSNRAAEKMELALKQLSQRMIAEKEPTVVLEEVLQGNDLPQHMLAIYCLGALDEVKKLLAILGDQDPVHAPDRDTAIFTLRRWLGRDAQQGPKLYDEKNLTGVLLADKEYKSKEAQAIFVLLHDFNADARNNPETFELLANYLLSDKVAVAELARWHLWRLSRSMGVKLASLDEFNAAIPRDAPQRQNAAKEVMDKVREGVLPPSDKGVPGTGGAAGRPRPEGKSGPGTQPKESKRQ